MKKLNKKGQLGIYLAAMIVVIIIIVLAALFAPIGARFTTQTYLAGETILNQTQEDIDAIQDADIKASINTNIQNAKDATDDNIEFLTALYKYAWLFVLIILGIGFFLLSRSLIEYNQGGLV
jgi:predicted PurR-regulated permease PerM